MILKPDIRDTLLVFFFIYIPVLLAGFIILAVALPFIGREKTELPRFLRWFDTFDPKEKLWGAMHYSNPLRVDDIPKDPRGFMARYNWLAIRNPINYFQYKVLGEVWNDGWLYASEGPSNVGDNEGHIGGKRVIIAGTKPIYEYYSVRPYRLLGRDLCVRTRIGHKIGNPEDRKEGDVMQFVVSWSPIHPYRGIK